MKKKAIKQANFTLRTLHLCITILVMGALVFSLASCGSEIDPKPGSTGASDRVVYAGRHNTNDLTLTITEKKTGKAAYVPKINDSYTLAVGENLSSGTVTLIEATDTTIKFTLRASQDGTIFTVTITLSSNRITNVSGTVTFDGEGTWNGPGNLNNGSSGGGGGGGKGSSSIGNGKTSTGNKVIAMDTATANSKLESMSDDRTLVFDNLEAKDMPVKGDIICSEPSAVAPYGFLRKVDTVTTSGGITTVTTVDATLEEAVNEAEVKQSIDLVFAESETTDGVTVVQDTSTAQRAVLPLIPTIKLGIDMTVGAEKNGVGGGVSLKGSLELSAKVNCDIKISKFTMQRFLLSTEPRFKADLTASIGGKREKEIPLFTLYKQKFAPVTIWVGPVPLVFVPELFIECVITAEGEIILSQKLVSWDYSFVFGVQYTKGSSLSAFKENTSKPAEYLKGLQIEFNGEVRVEPRVRFMYSLYDTASVGMSGGFFAKLAGNIGVPIGANANASANLFLSCGLAFGADAELKILGYSIGKLHINFFTIEWPIWEKTWSITTDVTGVSLNKASLSLAVGGTETLKATVSPSNATNKTVSWATSNSAVATVQNGTVTAKSAGTATITVTSADGNKKATCAVTVTTPVSSVSLNKPSLSLNVGSSETLTATVSPGNATNKNVSWATSNSAVATVQNGTVTAKSAGTATITVTTADGNKKATCAVTVTLPVSSVSLNKPSLSLTVGATETLTATVSPSNATNKTVSWATSNSAVATVQNGTVTAKSAGTATITVTTVDGNKMATCAVTVTSPTINKFEYYWVNEHGSLVTTSGGAITINAGTSLTITAQSSGYVVKQWNLNGVNTGQSETTYNFSSMQTGKHILGLFVEKDGKLYNSNITITVK